MFDLDGVAGVEEPLFATLVKLPSAGVDALGFGGGGEAESELLSSSEKSWGLPRPRPPRPLLPRGFTIFSTT